MVPRVDEIPCLSLREIETEETCMNLRAALTQFGFVALYDHGLPLGLRARAFEQIEAFFKLDLNDKLSCHRPDSGGARGYTPFGIEVAKDQSVPDLKEFFHVGREQVRLTRHQSHANAAQLSALSALPKNIWPALLPAAPQVFGELYQHLEAIGARVLSAIARCLDLSDSYFDDKIDVGNSLLRALHYPPLSVDPGEAVRAAAHEDINLITLLIGSEQPGLEILDRSGRWIQAPSGDELIICNVGDMLERLTNDVLVSTTHRVVNPKMPWAKESRYSLPFFLHPNSDFLIQSLDSCVSEQRPDRYPVPILADEFLRQRLIEIGLIKI